MNSPRSLLKESRSGWRFPSGWLVAWCALCGMVWGQVVLEKTPAGCRFHFPAYKGFDYVIGTSTDLKVWSEEAPVEGGGVPTVTEKVVSHRSFFVKVRTVPQHVVFVDEVEIEGAAAKEISVSGDGRFSAILCEEPGGTAVIFSDTVTRQVHLLRRNALGYPVALELEDGTRFVYSAHSPAGRTVVLEVFDAAGVRLDGPDLLTNVPGTFFGEAPAGLLAPRFGTKAASSWAEMWWVADIMYTFTAALNDLAELKFGSGSVGIVKFVAGVALKGAGGGAYQKPLEDLIYGLTGASCIYGAGAIVLAVPTQGLSLLAAGGAALECSAFVAETVDRVAKRNYISDTERLHEIQQLHVEAEQALDAALGGPFEFTPGGTFGTYTNLFGEYSSLIYTAKSRLSSIRSAVSGFANKAMETNGAPSEYAQALDSQETLKEQILTKIEEDRDQVEFQISHLTQVKAQAESSIAILQSALASPHLDPASRASLQQSLNTMVALKTETQAGLDVMEPMLPKMIGMENDIF